MAERFAGQDFAVGRRIASSSVYDMLREAELQELYTRYLLEPYELDEPEIQLRDWLGALNQEDGKKEEEGIAGNLSRKPKEREIGLKSRTFSCEIRNLTAKTNVGDFSDNV